jgi:hypothetical protein
VSGIESGQSQDRSLSYRDRALGLTVGSALLWLIAAAVIVADASLRDEIPDSVSSGLCALAGTATIGAMMSWTRAASSEMFGLLAAEVEQVSARLGTPAGTGTGRRCRASDLAGVVRTRPARAAQPRGREQLVTHG